MDLRWRLALVLSVSLSLVYWAVGSNGERMEDLVYVWAPAATTALLVFFRLGRGETLPRTGTSALAALRGRPLIAFVVLAVLTLAAVRWPNDLAPPTQVELLTVIHLPALAWLLLGWAVLGAAATPLEVFAAVRKSIESVITAGLYAAAGLALTLITIGLFHAIGVKLPNWITRAIFCGGPGLIPVAAVATVYDPARAPSEQQGEHGLARIIFTAGRLFLPLTLLVLVVYLIAIPFRFIEPFRNRDVLIAYNAMLFGVISLLVAATPVREGEVSGRAGPWVRRGIVAVAVCTLVVSIYAMAAVVYRTAEGGLTVNRLTVIGWNLVNIATLTLLLYRQGTDGVAWIAALHRTFRIGLVGYAGWTLFVLIVVPLLHLRGR